MTTIPEQRTPVEFLADVFEVLEAQRAEVEHLFIIRSAAHAAELGVQTRALCGVWEFAGFEPGDHLRDSWKYSHVQENDCPDCLAAARQGDIIIAERKS